MVAPATSNNENEVDRDRLIIKEILAAFAKEDREKFMQICIEKIPKNVAFIDGVVFLYCFGLNNSFESFFV